MPVLVTAIFHPREGQRSQLVAALQESIPAVHAEPGCVLYAIHDAEDGTITMVEKWDDAADLASHAAGSAVASLNAAVGELLAGPVTVTTMTPIAAGEPAKGEL